MSRKQQPSHGGGLHPLFLGIVFLAVLPVATGVALWWLSYVVHFGVGLVGGVILLAALAKAARARSASAAGLLVWTSLALTIAMPFIAFDLVAVGWLHTPKTVDRGTLQSAPPASLEGLIRLGPDVPTAVIETVHLAGSDWHVSAIAAGRALVVRADIRALSALTQAPTGERLARVTYWYKGWASPKSKPRLIMVARLAKHTPRAQLVVEWMPDARQRARSAWLWLLALLVLPNLGWLALVVVRRPHAISLSDLRRATGMKAAAKA